MLKQLKTRLFALTLVAGLLVTPVLAGNSSFSNAAGTGQPGLMCNANSSGGGNTGC